jgi:hypothetical protein
LNFSDDRTDVASKRPSAVLNMPRERAGPNRKWGVLSKQVLLIEAGGAQAVSELCIALLDKGASGRAGLLFASSG